MKYNLKQNENCEHKIKYKQNNKLKTNKPKKKHE